MSWWPMGGWRKHLLWATTSGLCTRYTCLLQFVCIVELHHSYNFSTQENCRKRLPVQRLFTWQFSKALLANLAYTPSDPDASQISSGSCCFNLASRLGLLPGQANESRAEYDTNIPLDRAISRGDCCCRHISRHGFILLMSQHFQEVTGGRKCIVLSTSIGRLKCYDFQDCTFIHFNPTTWASHTELIKNQNLDHILWSSQGQYLVNSDISDLKKYSWNPEVGDKLERLAIGHFYCPPDGVIYMTAEALTHWKKLQQFSMAVIDVVYSITQMVKGPLSFVDAMEDLPQYIDHYYSGVVMSRLGLAGSWLSSGTGADQNGSKPLWAALSQLSWLRLLEVVGLPF